MRLEKEVEKKESELTTLIEWKVMTENKKAKKTVKPRKVTSTTVSTDSQQTPNRHVPRNGLNQAPRKGPVKRKNPVSGKQLFVELPKKAKQNPRLCLVKDCDWFEEKGRMVDHFAEVHPEIVYEPAIHTKVFEKIDKETRLSLQQKAMKVKEETGSEEKPKLKKEVKKDVKKEVKKNVKKKVKKEGPKTDDA